MSPASARTRIVERTNHEVTAPPTEIKFVKNNGTNHFMTNTTDVLVFVAFKTEYTFAHRSLKLQMKYVAKYHTQYRSHSPLNTSVWQTNPHQRPSSACKDPILLHEPVHISYRPFVPWLSLVFVVN